MTLIRPASLDDAPAIAHVHVAVWRTTYRGIIPAEVLDALSISQHQTLWRQRISGSRVVPVFVAEDSAAGPIGFVDAGPNRGRYPEFASEIYALYVLDQWHGQGLGRALFSRAAAALAEAGLTSSLVWVLKDNPHRAFYEALGGTLLGEGVINIGGYDLVQVAYGWKEPPVARQSDEP